jgi:DNA-binding MarR family transcriptional regulator
MASEEGISELPARTRRAVGRLSRSLRQTRAGAEAGLSPSQYEVLVTIVGQGPSRLAELAAREGLNPTMLSRIAGKLEASGLVDRVADTSDGRVVHLAASRKGKELVESVRRERADALSVVLAGLTEDQRGTLEAALPVLDALAERLKDQQQ